MHDVARHFAAAPMFLNDGGEMGALMRQHDWSASPLGDPETWPQSLRSVVGLLLSSKFPMFLAWGPELGFLYNDAYIEILGTRHPSALGARFEEIWSDVWADVSPLVHAALAGEATYYEDLSLVTNRKGFDEQAWFTFSYSPVRDESGQVSGMYCAVAETTTTVLSERRQAFRLALEERLRDLDDPEAVMSAALALVGQHLSLDRVGYTEVIEDTVVRMTGSYVANGMAPLSGEFPLESFGEDRIARQRQGLTEVSDDVQADPAQDKDVWAAIDTRAMISVPLVREGQFRASLYVNSRNPRPWTGEEVALIEEVAARTWDAVERARAEAALRDSEAQFRLMADASPQIMWITDGEGRAEFFNKQWASYVGAADLPASASAVTESHVHPDDQAATNDAFAEARRTGTTFEVEHRIRSATGDYRWFLVRGEPYRGSEAGKILRWFGASVDIHDRRQAETELRESEERLRAIVETATDYAIFTTDPEGRIETWPKGAQEVFGWTAEEAVGQSDAIIFTPEDQAKGEPERERRKACEQGQAPNVRWHLRKDGSRVFIEGIARPLRSENGTITGLVKVGQDVTDRRATEEALKESEARFQAIANSIDQMVWSTRADGFHDYYNQRWYDYTGVPEGTTDGEGWNDVFHPDDRDQAWTAWRHSLETGEPYHIEYRLRHRSGRYRWVLGRAQPVRDEAGRVTRWYGTCTDIQDIVEAREVLARSRDELEGRVADALADRNRLWTLSEDMLARADYQGMMSAVSPAWTRVLGWSENELLKRPYSSFMHPEDTEVTLAALARMGKTGQPTRFENRIATADGGWKPIEWTVAPEPDSPNFIAVGRDLSEVKAQGEELRQAQEALRQSQKMEAVGQLTGGLAHDFNNLLAGISGSLELMATRITQGRFGDVERYLAAAQGSARRAAALTHRLLAFSRRQTLAPKVIDVNALVSGMEDLIRRTVGPEVDLESVVGGVWPVEVDPNQLENALLNLAINARDAMPDGGKITIETTNRWMDARASREQELTPGQYVSLSVSDTGTGMAPAVVARAFDPFYTTKPLGVGTGLGLSMVYGFARQSGGQVRITSEVGQGTTVSLYLPRHLGEVDGAEPDEPEMSSAEPAQAGETVLVIDDEPVVRMLVVDVLEELGYAALEASDGPEALKVLQSKARVDLVITDVGLPGGLNGRQVADAARVLRPALKVLFITGYAENATLNAGHLETGMQVVTKPFAVEDLARRIRGILSNE